MNCLRKTLYLEHRCQVRQCLRCSSFFIRVDIPLLRALLVLPVSSKPRHHPKSLICDVYASSSCVNMSTAHEKRKFCIWPWCSFYIAVTPSISISTCSLNMLIHSHEFRQLSETPWLLDLERSPCCHGSHVSK
ncbi:hypothetical protein BO83DRAFT_214581 [Aspergillus eucalypticola CBS 122712]|uniref:Uncharacterized protein n=1 Tax=Aspergillus eucalypticola (strain CBS 122712 / IBT 29274) TaxID=1448314 RepID=A0A317VWK6_ASPEC|nr:uncharacterized protein BO83DRAFT_214581 [Aspergillus eucalypticola CBS 122712]PWY78766.1 hypothetical protein BO83DRAFT_214581 [Aspergillus eucalypticola CBS 122712]